MLLPDRSRETKRRRTVKPSARQSGRSGANGRKRSGTSAPTATASGVAARPRGNVPGTVAGIGIAPAPKTGTRTETGRGNGTETKTEDATGTRIVAVQETGTGIVVGTKNETEKGTGIET